MLAAFDAWQTVIYVSVLLLTSAIVYAVYLNNNVRQAKSVLEAEVNERLRTEKQLAENENRLRQIIATEPECVKVQARDGTILEMNPAGLRLVDATSPRDMIGVSVYRVIAPDFTDAYEALTRRVFAGQTEILEFQIISFKNRRLWVETHAAPLKDAEGRIVALLGITRDIGARKLYEQQMRRESRELAHSLRLDTMAQMSTMLAHELNQPLTAIANYSRGCLLRLRANGQAGSDVVKAMELVCGQADRAANIVRSLRSYMSKGATDHAQLDVNCVIQEALAIAELEAQSQNVRICRNFAEDLPPIAGDATQIEQVVLNIVRNGIDAMDGVPICDRLLKINTAVAPNGMARVQIVDAGSGQGDDGLEEMFNPFFTTKRNGMGMGLSISRSIVEAHGGHLTAVANAPDPGLTFTFELPPISSGSLQ